MLQVDDMIGVYNNLDIAKGSNKLPMTFKEITAETYKIKIWQRE